ncbi:MAG: ParA family protein [Hyphomicrobiaceae bacterium]|nr:ParA family protein [Hyphomicrobiaceae bacterium]
MFLSFISQKGGTGKSTLALHIAAIAATQGHNTLLIDADPQASAMAWYACRVKNGHPAIPNLTVTAINNGTITGQMAELSKAYDFVVIDGPPRGDLIARDVILASNIVLVPTQLSGFDVWAGDSITKTIEELRPIQELAAKQPLDWFYVVNKKDPRTLAGKTILKALENSTDHVLETHICARASFVESTSQGLTILETEPARSRARREIEALAEQITLLITRRQQERAAA